MRNSSGFSYSAASSRHSAGVSRAAVGALPSSSSPAASAAQSVPATRRRASVRVTVMAVPFVSGRSAEHRLMAGPDQRQEAGADRRAHRPALGRGRAVS
ncbi:hypothetical protein OHB00_05155 [Streptomyces sp. NBC_00631]|uniref:hypothetical protein n=1 Tax=Streptomyces sp. NBC_00631 TaxID=2975793 RepID=UPI0030DE402E